MKTIYGILTVKSIYKKTFVIIGEVEFDGKYYYHQVSTYDAEICTFEAIPDDVELKRMEQPDLIKMITKGVLRRVEREEKNNEKIHKQR